MPTQKKSPKPKKAASRTTRSRGSGKTTRKAAGGAGSRKARAKAAGVSKKARPAASARARGKTVKAGTRKTARAKTSTKGRAGTLKKARAATKKTAPAKVAKPRVTRRRAPTSGGVQAAKRAGQALKPENLAKSLLEIVRRTSAELPEDAVRSIATGRSAEGEGSNALWAMKVIEENIDLARQKSLPLCQDTGSILFYVKAPIGFDSGMFRRTAEQAVAKATAKGYLRQNSVDSLTGRNSGNNLGPGSPVFHFEQWEQNGLDVRLILKGGGCENVGAQYAMPDTRLGAGRDLKGVEKVILDAVYQAQGKGCGPGILGVCVGGDRASGYSHSKEQFLRPLDDVNPVPELAALEERVTEKANALGIGPMGFGGKTTLLGCKIGVLNRLPASYYVSVSYMCWAFRRQGAELAMDGSIRRWLY